MVWQGILPGHDAIHSIMQLAALGGEPVNRGSDSASVSCSRVRMPCSKGNNTNSRVQGGLLILVLDQDQCSLAGLHYGQWDVLCARSRPQACTWQV